MNFDHSPDGGPEELPSAVRTPDGQRRPRRGCGFWLIGTLCVLFFAATMILLTVLVGFVFEDGAARVGAPPRGRPERLFVEQTLEGGGSQKVLLIPISGIITDFPRTELFYTDPGMVATIRDMLRLARRDENVRAVLLTIDSPGGGITASDTLYHEVSAFHSETGVHVSAMLGDVAASGGYYVACAAQHIVAHPTTITGSIGVIMPLVGIEDLMAKIGVKARPIKSGEMKDTGSIYRDLTPEEQRMLQGIVNEYRNRFVSVVHEGFRSRGVAISRERLESYCDGRIFTGQQAKEIGFVDQVGYFHDACKAIYAKAGIDPDDSRIVTYRRKPGLIEMLFARYAAPRPEGLTIRLEGAFPETRGPRFLYLWTVGNPGI